MDPITLALTLASQFAPGIIRHFTNSDTAGGVAEKVIGIAKAVTGLGTGDEALAALSTNPSLALQFKTAVLASDADLEKAYLGDRADARKRDTAFVTAGRWNWRADFLALLSVGGLVICVWFVARDSDMPERAVNAIMFVAGVLAAAVRDVYSFEFGSSRGSKEKDDTLAALTRNR